MTKFKIGDRVKVVANSAGESGYGIPVGSVFRIGHIERGDRLYECVEDVQNWKYASSNEVELVASKVSDKSSENATTFPRVEKKEEFTLKIASETGITISRQEAEQLRDRLNEVLK